ALEKVGGSDPDIRLEDVYLEMAVTKAGYVIDIIGEVVATYRKNPTNTYKNAPFMVDNVVTRYNHFRDHPNYDQVIMRFHKSNF
ncbi:glycosyltransferase family 2 protein, partial [Pseudomonas aeruginosa]